MEPIRVALSLDKMGDKAMKANLTTATAVFGGLLVLNLGQKNPRSCLGSFPNGDRLIVNFQVQAIYDD